LHIKGEIIEPCLLFEKLHELDVGGSYDIDLPPISGKRAARKATVFVRFGQFTNPVTLTAIEVLESGTNPNGEEPICWRLLTSHKVSTFEEAKNVVGWYAMRWTIEQLFRTMKSDGMRVEEIQIEKIEHLKKMAVVACEASV
jgi:Transposase DDE domain